MKKIFLAIVLMSVSAFSQKSIHNYNYVIVSNQFDFVSSTDEHQTSSLTKFLFNKRGFKTFLNNERLPENLIKNNCLVLKADVKSKTSFMSTKLFIELKDCNNNIVFRSKEGKSKQKGYKKAYHEAIRKAFASVPFLQYKGKPLQQKPKNVIIENTKPTKAILIEKKEKIVKPKVTNVLYAQVKENGYQLVNTQPTIVFNIINTNVKNVFIIKNKNGILYKDNATWVAEYYKNGKKVLENYRIKF